MLRAIPESDRLVLERVQARVDTPFGRIGVKQIFDPDGGVTVTAEYDDCKKAARKMGVPLREVVRAAEEAGRVSADATAANAKRADRPVRKRKPRR